MLNPVRTSYLGQQVSLILEDIRNSWYFRIWAFAWIFCAIMSFSAMIIFGAESTQQGNDETWQLYVESVESIQYPDFKFETPETAFQNNIVAMSCNQQGVQISIGSCGDNIPLSSCRVVSGSQVSASISTNELVCTINVTEPTDANTLLGFQVLPQGDSFNMFDTWIRPDNSAFILLTKTTIEWDGTSSNTVWGRSLMYHTSVQVPNYYVVTLSMDQFYVYHYEQTDLYNRWMSVGDTGGYAFFMYIIHTVFMWIVGIFFENDSRFLASFCHAISHGPHKSVRGAPRSKRSTSNYGALPVSPPPPDSDPLVAADAASEQQSDDNNSSAPYQQL